MSSIFMLLWLEVLSYFSFQFVYYVQGYKWYLLLIFYPVTMQNLLVNSCVYVVVWMCMYVSVCTCPCVTDFLCATWFHLKIKVLFLPVNSVYSWMSFLLFFSLPPLLLSWLVSPPWCLVEADSGCPCFVPDLGGGNYKVFN